MKRWLALAAALAAVLVPGAAAACPACAMRTSPGVTVLALVGGMIAVPYVVAVIAIRVVRKLDRS